MNSHYIPQFILRNFCNSKGNLVYCDFDNKTTSVRNTKSVFSEEGYYPDQLEKDLCHKAEYAFANLYHNKLEKATGTIDLTPEEMFTLRKYLIVSSIRYKYELTKNDEFVMSMLPEELHEMFRIDTFNSLNRILAFNDANDLFDYLNFVEKNYYFNKQYKKNNTDINIPLFAEIREVVSNYLFFVSPAGKEEFVIPDIGRGAYQGAYAYEKLDIVLNLMLALHDDFSMQMARMISPRDYMFYPLSKNLAIISMSVFYKTFSDFANQFGAKNMQMITSSLGFSDNSILKSSLTKSNNNYHYEIKQINPHDVCHLNCISINQSKHFIACSDLSKIQQSISFAKVNIKRDVSFMQS